MRPLDIDSLTLDYGSHAGPEWGMCVMEAVAWVAGESWTDRPACVSPVIAGFLRSLNDGLGAEDRQDLRRWIVPVIGTAGDDAAETERHWLIQDWLVRRALPVLLRRLGLTAEAEALATLSEQSPETCRASVPLLRIAARTATAVAFSSSTAFIAYDAAYNVARSNAGVAANAAVATWPELEESVHDLIERMIAVLPAPSAAR